MDEKEKLEQQINELKIKLLALKKKGESIKNYTLYAEDGKKTSLLDLFGRRKHMILIHNMGSECPYCTLWADGFIGLHEHFLNRAAFVIVSPDPPAVMKHFKESRNWPFVMASAKGTPFNKDMGFEEDGEAMPGVSILEIKDTNIVRVGKDKFGPGDNYCSIWHFFDLFSGEYEWEPKFKY